MALKKGTQPSENSKKQGPSTIPQNHGTFASHAYYKPTKKYPTFTTDDIKKLRHVGGELSAKLEGESIEEWANPDQVQKTLLKFGWRFKMNERGYVQKILPPLGVALDIPNAKDLDEKPTLKEQLKEKENELRAKEETLKLLTLQSSLSLQLETIKQTGVVCAELLLDTESLNEINHISSEIEKDISSLKEEQVIYAQQKLQAFSFFVEDIKKNLLDEINKKSLAQESGKKVTKRSVLRSPHAIKKPAHQQEGESVTAQSLQETKQATTSQTKERTPFETVLEKVTSGVPLSSLDQEILAEQKKGFIKTTPAPSHQKERSGERVNLSQEAAVTQTPEITETASQEPITSKTEEPILLEETIQAEKETPKEVAKKEPLTVSPKKSEVSPKMKNVDKLFSTLSVRFATDWKKFAHPIVVTEAPHIVNTKETKLEKPKRESWTAFLKKGEERDFLADLLGENKLSFRDILKKHAQSVSINDNSPADLTKIAELDSYALLNSPSSIPGITDEQRGELCVIVKNLEKIAFATEELERLSNNFSFKPTEHIYLEEGVTLEKYYQKVQNLATIADKREKHSTN